MFVLMHRKIYILPFGCLESLAFWLYYSDDIMVGTLIPIEVKNTQTNKAVRIFDGNFD